MYITSITLRRKTEETDLYSGSLAGCLGSGWMVQPSYYHLFSGCNKYTYFLCGTRDILSCHKMTWCLTHEGGVKSVCFWIFDHIVPHCFLSSSIRFLFWPLLSQKQLKRKNLTLGFLKNPESYILQTEFKLSHLLFAFIKIYSAVWCILSRHVSKS